MSLHPMRRKERRERASPREVVPVLESPMTKTFGRESGSVFIGGGGGGEEDDDDDDDDDAGRLSGRLLERILELRTS